MLFAGKMHTLSIDHCKLSIESSNIELSADGSRSSRSSSRSSSSSSSRSKLRGDVLEYAFR